MADLNVVQEYLPLWSLSALLRALFLLISIQFRTHVILRSTEWARRHPDRGSKGSITSEAGGVRENSIREDTNAVGLNIPHAADGFVVLTWP